MNKKEENYVYATAQISPDEIVELVDNLYQKIEALEYSIEQLNSENARLNDVILEAYDMLHCGVFDLDRRHK